MKIAPCRYDESGELLAPREVDVKVASGHMGRFPTKDEGWYHRFQFFAKSEREIKAKRMRFFQEIGAVPRSMILTVNERKFDMFGAPQWTVDVVYVIEKENGAAEPFNEMWFLNRYSQQ